MKFEDQIEHAKILDKLDPLKKFKEHFYLQKNIIYMCGNSLGLVSKESEQAILNMLNKWKEEGVQIWSIDKSKYFLYSDYIAALMAPLVGCSEDEIVFVGSTTVSIHQAISTFYIPNKQKYKIVIDELNFSSDRYVVESQVKLKGLLPEQVTKVICSADGRFLCEADIIAALTEDVAIALLPGVVYTTAQVLDIKKISRVARKQNIIIGWDLSHAVGAVELDLNDYDIDFAVWCTYKYLNGGPGSIAATYVNRRHFCKLPGLAGWFGNKNETQFLFRPKFDPQQDASGWQIGTPSLLSMAALEGSLKIIKEARMPNIREKSLKLTSYLMYLIEKNLKSFGFMIGTLEEDRNRGGHVTLEHVEAYSISKALRAHGVISDFRYPNQIRLTPTALYTSYEAVFKTVEILMNIMKNKSYQNDYNSRSYVI